MIGKTLGHYEILELVGKGGMGEVFRAKDTRLGRQVAIKVLPEELAQDPERRKRFEREARAVASLKHPNIVTLHSVEEADGLLFLTMELVQGRTLSELIPRGGLPLDQVFEIAIPLADAMQRAHENGIAHRDLKPANVMLDEGRTVKILDFGLAKWIESPPETDETVAAESHTAAGQILGTVHYMSPEQASGKALDHRSDIFSLGILLYEMATGNRPFKGETRMETLSSILRDDPPSVTQLNADLPPHLGRIIRRCLAKEAERRYQTALDLRNELEALRDELKTGSTEPTGAVAAPARRPRRRAWPWLIVAAGAVAATVYWMSQSQNPVEVGSATGGRADSIATTDLRRLAVLPFGNLRSDPDTDFLGYAVADQVIGTLSYFKNLTVRPSSSVRRYESQDIDATTAGGELRVDYVLTGNYLKEGDAIRLNLELVDVGRNEVLWRESLDAKYENAFALQDAVTELVVRKLEVQFSEEEQRRGNADVPRDPLAYEYYLRAVAQPVSVPGNRVAIELLEKSVALDSTFAPAFAELGERKRLFYSMAVNDPRAVRAGVAELQRALRLNDQNLQALGVLSTHLMDNGEVARAMELAHRAVSINPNDGNSQFSLSYLYRYAGAMDAAVEAARRAIQLDPGNPSFRSVAVAYLYAGDLDAALEAIDLDRESAWAAGWKGQIHLRMGQEDLALIEFDRGLASEPSDVIAAWILGMRAAITGDTENGLAALARLEESHTSDGEIFYSFGSLYALLGDSANSVRYLKRAVDAGFFCYPHFANDTFLDPIRDEPEFQEILAEAKARHEAFEARFFPAGRGLSGG